MRIRTRVASAATIGTVALSTVAAATGTAGAQPFATDSFAVAQSGTNTTEWESLPPELRAQITNEIDTLNNTAAAEGSEEWSTPRRSTMPSSRHLEGSN